MSQESQYNTISLYCDGASRGNPGPAAIGAVLKTETGAVLESISEAIGHATNNEAEYRSLIAGLEAVLQRLNPEVAQVLIHMDSQLVVRQVLGQYRVKNERLKPLYQQVRNLLLKIPRWQAHHIPRNENKEADRLANLAYES